MSDSLAMEYVGDHESFIVAIEHPCRWNMNFHYICRGRIRSHVQGVTMHDASRTRERAVLCKQRGSRSCQV
jgi:hypothetical protein